VKKALLVARWEFVTTVTRVPFIFAIVALPLFYGGMFALAAIAGRSATQSSGRTPVALVDRAHLVDLAIAETRIAERDRRRDSSEEEIAAMVARRSPAAAAAVREMSAPPRLTAYGDLDEALAALRAGHASSVFEIAEDYLATGSLTVYEREVGVLAQSASRARQGLVADAIRASLLKPLEPQTQARAFGPVALLSRRTLADDGTFVSGSDSSGLGPLAGSFGVFMLLTMSIFMSAGFLQQATLADRTNRMIEILISSVEPGELVLGKLLGLGAAGLVQVGVNLALIILPGATLLAIFQISLAKLALSVVFFVLGFLTFACLMTGTGMLGRSAQESAQFSTIWILAASMPWFFIANISGAPNGLIARTFSYFPLTSPIAMMMRISATNVAPLEVAAVIVLDLVAIYLIFRASARIFRAAALMYGKRPTLPELIRWIRA
jgi:ABC-2 type transport system permease protein